MSRPVLRSLLLVVTAISASVLVAPPAPAQAAPTTSAVFNDPTKGNGSEIQDRIVQLIQDAPAGSRIRMAMFYADDPTIPNALVAAKNRGVNVQVIFDSTSKQYTPYTTLVKALGTSTSASSWVLACPAKRGCIGTRAFTNSAGTTTYAINHNKFFLFSSTGGASDVVVQSSANLHPGRDGLEGWNNALVLVGNTGIYNAYNTYFGDLEAQKVNNNYYDTGQPPVASGSAKAHFFPRAESGYNGDPTSGWPSDDPSEDPVETVLDHVQCSGNSTVGTTDGTHRTIIRVAMNIFSRTYLAKKLWNLDEAGCDVQVAQNWNTDSASETQALNDLLAHTGSKYGGPVVKYYCSADPVWIHSKYFQVEGKYYGVPDRTITWTGSANLSTNSLRQSDETMLQYEDSSVFDAYRTNFSNITGSSDIRSTANGGTPSCK